MLMRIWRCATTACSRRVLGSAVCSSISWCPKRTDHMVMPDLMHERERNVKWLCSPCRDCKTHPRRVQCINPGSRRPGLHNGIFDAVFIIKSSNISRSTKLLVWCLILQFVASSEMRTWVPVPNSKGL
jgi:hypothetical protein